MSEPHSRCPYCGVNLYLSDKVESSGKAGASLGGCFGWLLTIVGGLGSLLFTLMLLTTKDEAPPTPAEPYTTAQIFIPLLIVAAVILIIGIVLIRKARNN
jgi:hypothetical protein